MVYLSVVLVPLGQEADDGVEQEDEEEDQDENFLRPDPDLLVSLRCDVEGIITGAVTK